MTRSLADSVVVITGASSGIGRAAALAFARRGAAVVVAARRGAPLAELAAECERHGAQALAVPTNVTDATAVEALARCAIERFGRIDVWVNNAAVSLFARFEEAPLADIRRVVDTNLFGHVHGARAVLPYLREQGSGVIINVGSMVGRASQPYLSAYVATKHAIRGLSMSLRQELMLQHAKEIHVCTVLPATIDTPLFQHAANYTGWAAKAMPPVYPAEQVAEAIVDLARHPRREVFVGRAGRGISRLFTLAPGLAERQLATMTDKQQLDHDTPATPTAGNLFAPVAAGATVSGGWRRGPTATRPRLAPVGAVAGGLVLIRWLWQRATRRRRTSWAVWAR